MDVSKHWILISLRALIENSIPALECRLCRRRDDSGTTINDRVKIKGFFEGKIVIYRKR